MGSVSSLTSSRAFKPIRKSLPGYDVELFIESDGDGGSISERWSRACVMLGPDRACDEVARIDALVRNPALECDERVHYFVLERVWTRCRIGVLLPKVEQVSPQHVGVQFFATGMIDAQNSAAVSLVAHLSRVLPQ